MVEILAVCLAVAILVVACLCRALLSIREKNRIVCDLAEWALAIYREGRDENERERHELARERLRLDRERWCHKGGKALRIDMSGRMAERGPGKP